MKQNKYSTISLANVERQFSVAGVKNLIVSGALTHVHDTPFDLRYPHIVDDIVFAICVEGVARIRINLQEYEIESNSIITILPNYILQLIEQSDDLHMEFFFFTFDFVSDIKLITDDGIFSKVMENPCIKIEREQTNTLIEFHAFIVKQYKKTNHQFRDHIAKNLLCAMIYEVIQYYQMPTVSLNERHQTRKEIQMQGFVELVFRHYRKERSTIFYANKMHLTPKYLSKVVRETSGKSILQWVDEMVLMAAKALLKSSEMTVAQISEELNFANPSFFGSYFRKRTGMTPVKYRDS